MIGFHAPETAPPPDPFFEPANLRRLQRRQDALIAELRSMPTPGAPIERPPAPRKVWTLDDLLRPVSERRYLSRYRHVVVRHGQGHRGFTATLTASLSPTGRALRIGDGYRTDTEGALAVLAVLNGEVTP